jgi:hypothetical protein
MIFSQLLRDYKQKESAFGPPSSQPPRKTDQKPTRIQAGKQKNSPAARAIGGEPSAEELRENDYCRLGKTQDWLPE